MSLLHNKKKPICHVNTKRSYQASPFLYKQLTEKSKPSRVHHLYQKSYFWAKKIAG